MRTALSQNAEWMTEWLRELSTKLGFPDLGNIGSHSCKATLLSWCAKAGIDKDTRRTLGYHAQPGDRSVDAYARDTQAAPRRQLSKVLDLVRAKDFLPDVTRSGRWSLGSRNKDKPVISEVRNMDNPNFCAICKKEVYEGRGPKFMCACGSKVHRKAPCFRTCEKSCGFMACAMCMKEHICPKETSSDGFDASSSSSETSGSTSSETGSDCEKAAIEVQQERDDVGVTFTQEDAKDISVVVHRLYKTVHRNQDGTPACNIKGGKAKYDVFECSEAAQMSYPKCLRKACFMTEAR